jgi:hypothetical protein
MDCIDLAQDKIFVAGSRDHGNKPSISVNYLEIFE